MTSSRQNDLFSGPLTPAEETLQLLASLPAPDGLVDRVQAGVRNAPRSAPVLRWPVSMMSGGFVHSSVLRGAAAAAIVCVVAGGGWRIYSHVQPTPSAHMMIAPAHIGGGGAFSSAGAMRTPDTLNGPVLTHVIVAEPQRSADAAKTAPTPEVVKKHKKAAPSAPARRP